MQKLKIATILGTRPELICMLWANELFDRERPDTVARGLISKGDI